MDQLQQIILYAALALIGVLILGLFLKYLKTIRDTKNNELQITRINKRSTLNLLLPLQNSIERTENNQPDPSMQIQMEQIQNNIPQPFVQILIEPTQNYKDLDLFLAHNQIIYKFQNGAKQIVYEFKVDKNYNEECSKYEKMNPQILIINEQNNGQQKLLDENALIQSKVIQSKQSNPIKLVQFYNQEIQEEQINTENIQLLDALIKYLNQKTKQEFLKIQSKQKLILFMPSTILQLENKQFNFETVKKKYKHFNFSFEEIEYNLKLICSSVFFITKKLTNDFYILVEVRFQENLIIIHEQSLQENSEDDYAPYVNILNQLFELEIDKAQYCSNCKTNNNYPKIEDVANKALQYSILGQIDNSQKQAGLTSSFNNFVQEIKQQVESK
ncbi:unnamed protein product [Paramecium sonneborni]|uniref:Transmembrane protein n=1 Tax=Paramecium sonneborni TaxID=65129 RepID=A0A8S1NXE4_9CILI|nr:unnamed protein product [Paramecium sonneborni]